MTPTTNSTEQEEGWVAYDRSRAEYGVMVEVKFSDGKTEAMNAHDWFYTAFLRDYDIEPFVVAHRIVRDARP